MGKPEESAKEAARIARLKAEEAKALSKEQERTRAYQAREKEIEKGQKAREIQRAEERANEDVKEQAKDKARKESYLAREKIIADEQEARKSKS